MREHFSLKFRNFFIIPPLQSEERNRDQEGCTLRSASIHLLAMCFRYSAVMSRPIVGSDELCDGAVNLVDS
jgi:hypothetical protein